MDSSGLGAVRLGADKIHNCFGLSKINPTIEESSLGKFPWFGKAGAKMKAPGQNVSRDEQAAVTIDLDDILSGVRSGRAHDGKHDLINQVTIAADAAEVDGVRGKLGWLAAVRHKHCVCNFDGARARHADNGNAPFTNRSGNCGNRVFHELLAPNDGGVYQRSTNFQRGERAKGNRARRSGGGEDAA